MDANLATAGWFVYSVLVAHSQPAAVLCKYTLVNRSLVCQSVFVPVSFRVSFRVSCLTSGAFRFLSGCMIDESI